MRCRKCKYYKKEGNIAYFAVHFWESHGYPIEDLKENFPEHKELIEELIKNHKETGKKGMFKND